MRDYGEVFSFFMISTDPQGSKGLNVWEFFFGGIWMVWSNERCFSPLEVGLYGKGIFLFQDFYGLAGRKRLNGIEWCGVWQQKTNNAKKYDRGNRLVCIQGGEDVVEGIMKGGL